MEEVMRKLISVLLLSVCASFASLPLAVAQDATPESSESILASLDYPQLHINVYDDRFEAPGLVEAGRTLIVYENVGQGSRHSFLMRLPDGFDIANPPEEEGDGPPSWFFDASYPGFVGETQPGTTSYAVVDLTPGIYLIFDDFIDAFVVVGPISDELAVAPPAVETVDLFDFNFTFPDRVAAGRQVWTVTNSGQQPHEILLSRSPEPVTSAQVLELLAAENDDDDSNATPVGGGPALEDLIPVGALGWLSPGATAWAEVDLEPGTYVALCFVFDPETGMPHAMEGMVATFTVE
jgi:hypothetical protein